MYRYAPWYKTAKRRHSHTQSQKDCTDGQMRAKNEIESGQSYAQKGAEMTSTIEKIVQWSLKRTRDCMWIST